MTKNDTSYPFFVIKSKLEHISLDKNVFYTYLKFGTCKSDIKRDIHVQKIKVEKSLINSLLLYYTFFSPLHYVIRWRKNQAFI